MTKLGLAAGTVTQRQKELFFWWVSTCISAMCPHKCLIFWQYCTLYNISLKFFLIRKPRLRVVKWLSHVIPVMWEITLKQWWSLSTLPGSPFRDLRTESFTDQIKGSKHSVLSLFKTQIKKQGERDRLGWFMEDGATRWKDWSPCFLG